MRAIFKQLLVYNLPTLTEQANDEILYSIGERGFLPEEMNLYCIREKGMFILQIYNVWHVAYEVREKAQYFLSKFWLILFTTHSLYQIT